MDFLTSTGKARMILPKEAEFAVGPDGEWWQGKYKGVQKAGGSKVHGNLLRARKPLESHPLS